MFILKTLKNAPTCFDLIQIILGELIHSLLKSLILKFVKNVKRQCGAAAAWHMVYVRVLQTERPLYLCVFYLSENKERLVPLTV